MRPPARASTLPALCSAAVLAASLLTLPSASAVSIAADSGTCPAAAGSYGGGSGSIADPLLIQTPEHLQRLRDTSADWNKNVRLTADIDMGGCVWGSTLGEGGTFWTAGFDGDGHVVSGLDINLSVTGSANVVYAGFIAYLGTGGSITDLGFTGDVTASVVGTGFVFAYAGGLVGFTLNTPITGSFATGDVTVNVTATPSGQNPDPDDARAQIQVGGLVGVLQGNMSNSYARGDVQVTATTTATGTGRSFIATELGGLAGYTQRTVTNSYATGSVTSTLSATGGGVQNVSDARGGFLGWYGGNTLSGNVWDTTSSGLANAAANGPQSGVFGFPTAGMQTVSNFGANGLNWSLTDGFSASTTWSMCAPVNDGLPYLSAFHATSPCPVPPPPPPVPATAPLDVAAIAGDRAAVVSWASPASPGSFPVTNYQVSVLGGSASCLVPASSTTCTVTGLTNGEAYSFHVRALTGAGWSVWSQPSNAVTPQAPVTPSIMITGTRGEVRGKPGVIVSGETSGLGMGAILQPWVRVGDAPQFTQGRATILVDMSGTFTWQRRSSQTLRVYLQTPDEQLRSNTITVRR